MSAWSSTCIVEKGHDRGEDQAALESMTAAIAICVVATILIGLWPDPVINICAQAARTLFAGGA